MADPTPTWLEICAPIVKRCEVAAAVNGQAVWDAQGARALGKLIKSMAMQLDNADRRPTPVTTEGGGDV